MNLEEFRLLCLSLPYAEERAPWEERYGDLITYSVGGKWYCLLNLEDRRCNIKCVTEQIENLCESYQGIVPAWHMNKRHWVTLFLDSDVSDSEIERLIKQSYQLVVNKLPKKIRNELGV